MHDVRTEFPYLMGALFEQTERPSLVYYPLYSLQAATLVWMSIVSMVGSTLGQQLPRTTSHEALRRQILYHLEASCSARHP